ncbi:ankyrin repeat domain-containing protein [Sulfurimonas hongkongensis]|uniref:ankyrin repeat domain-containing protein n=1 Tax=Sulfurimonas hongkongensis TaxID=1172190 RepID=UPI0004CE1673|nr:ankyrin repeat domain-containing protein [Sulfurimonas hongkongensis]
MHNWIKILKNNDFIGAKKYIKSGADVNDANDTGESVLACAIRNRCDMDLLMLLIQNGADIYDFDDEGVSIFDMSVSYDNIDIVNFLLEQGIDVNSTNRKSRFTPLMAAVSYGRIEIVKLLLKHGADKEAVDAKGFSCIDFARKMNKKSMLVILDYDENAPKNKAYAR